MEQDLNTLLDAVAKNVLQLTESITELIGQLKENKCAPEETPKEDRRGESWQLHDGFGSSHTSWCKYCEDNSIQIIRPGKFQCYRCSN